jgi:hypothetical protein
MKYEILRSLRSLRMTGRRVTQDDGEEGHTDLMGLFSKPFFVFVFLKGGPHEPGSV